MGQNPLAGYKTILERAEDEFIERKSRFIGSIQPVSTEQEALAFIEEKNKARWDAHHNAYAYLLRDGTQRCSDAGEPQGTAGVPMLEVLQREGLVDVCAVVTRYFGGVLLGAGGLVRAYAHGAKLAVDAAAVMHMNPCAELELDMDYGMYGKVTYLLPQHRVQTLSSDFGAAVRLRVLITNERLPAFRRALEELTSAQVYPRVIEERFADLE